MTRIIIPSPIKNAAWNHLLYKEQDVEEAAFLYASIEGNNFVVQNWEPVPPTGFTIQTAYHIELTDETRATVIKNAHDRGASLIEMHSHLGRWPAQFSPSDQSGFVDWVPHVRWRLKGRPYAAIVIAEQGIDGLAWMSNSGEYVQVAALEVGGQTVPATGLTIKEKRHGSF